LIILPAVRYDYSSNWASSAGRFFLLLDYQLASLRSRLSPKATTCRVLPFPGVKFIVSWGGGGTDNSEQWQ
jgi:hypothetical protein